jgi:large subunit ribosomal protein L25
MASTTENLAVETRPTTGTTSSHALRHAGKIPATLFGHGADALSISIDAKAFDELLHAGGKNHLLNLTIDGGSKDTALVRELQRDPISRRIIHADLQRVGATETISASLPIVTVGTPEGVKMSGGVMDVISHTLGVTGPANALPENIEIDVSHLNVYDHITAGDVKLPAGITLDVEPGTVLIAIAPSKTEQEATDSAPVVPAAEVPTVGAAAETTP